MSRRWLMVATLLGPLAGAALAAGASTPTFNEIGDWLIVETDLEGGFACMAVLWDGRRALTITRLDKSRAMVGVQVDGMTFEQDDVPTRIEAGRLVYRDVALLINDRTSATLAVELMDVRHLFLTEEVLVLVGERRFVFPAHDGLRALERMDRCLESHRDEFEAR